MRNFGSTILSLGIALGFGFGYSVATTNSAQAWEPKKPVEFIIMAGKGGGADKAVRFMQNILSKNKMSGYLFSIPW